MEVSFFQSFTSKRPLSSTLEAVAAMIKGNERVKAITESYRVTRDKAVKESSPLFGVAARFEGGKNKGDICRLTGLSMVDIDHVNTYVVGDKIKNEKVKNERVKNEKLGLLEALRARAVADPHTVMCYRTISGEGLRVIFRYELEAAYSLVQQYFRVPTPGEKGEFMPVALALQVISGNISQKLSAILVGRAFKEQGFACKKVKNVRGYIVVRYTAQEMQARRDLAATL